MEVNKIKLKEAMLDKCFNIAGLRRASGLSRTAITRMLKGGSRVNMATIGKVAKALGVPAKDLISE